MVEMFGLFVGVLVSAYLAVCVLTAVAVALALVSYPVFWAMAKVIGYVPQN